MTISITHNLMNSSGFMPENKQEVGMADYKHPKPISLTGRLNSLIRRISRHGST
jgi:hypothetical protein